MRNNDLRSQSLDLLRFPLSVVIVIIHVFSANGLILQDKHVNVNEYSFFLEVNHVIDGFLRGQSVPIYFFISGFVFFLGVEGLTKEKYFQKLKNRAKTLLIPYIIWNFVAILFLLVRLLPCFNGYLSYTDSTFNLSLSSFLSCFWMYDGNLNISGAGANTPSLFPLNFPLWFLRDLMIVVLCVPLLYWILKYTKYYFVLLLGLLWFVLSYWDIGYLNPLLCAFFFFSWGTYMSINKKDMLIEFGRFFKISIFLYPLLALLYIISMHFCPNMSGMIKELNVFVGLLFAYNLAAYLLRRNYCKVNSFLASASFFIFISHGLIGARLVKVFYLLIMPASNIALLMVYFLSTLFTILLLLFIFSVLRRYTPTFLKVIAGRK